MTDTNQSDNDALVDFFAAAKASPEPLDDKFMARLHADALAALPVAKPPRSNWFAFIRDQFSQLGGWPVGASLASALLAGFMFGISPPEVVLDMTTSYFDADSLEDIAGFSIDDGLEWEGS